MFIHEPLSCGRLKKAFPAGNTYAQAKLQGYRATAFKQADGRVLVFGRDQRPHLEFTARFPKLLDTPWYKEIRDNAPPLTSVDAEICCPGYPDSYVATALRNPGDELVITTFAVPFVDGVNISGHNLHKAERVFRSFTHGLDFAPYVYRPNGINSMAECHDIVQEFMDNGYEGAVLKKSNYFGWWKVKRTDTVDGIITSICPGEGKYHGLVGSVTISLYNSQGKLVEVASAGGMTDEVRHELTRLHLADMLVGRIAVVEYQEVAGQGRLKHPRFSHLRDDKPAGQCTMDQLHAGS